MVHLPCPQRKGVKQRNKSPVIKHSENPTPKQDSWWATKLILEPEDNIKLKLPHTAEGEADQAAASERQKKKNQHYPTIWQDYSEFLLKYKHWDLLLEE
jgi:hypothetical protein